MRAAIFLATTLLMLPWVAAAQDGPNKVGPLVGTWENEGFSVTYFAEGFAIPVSKSGDTALGALEASVSGEQLSLRNLTAPNGATPESTRCSMTSDGVYQFQIDDGVLTMQALNDPCADRAASVSSFVMERVSTTP